MAINDTIKKLFGKVLSIGTPPEKEVLYKEVIKRKVPQESPEKIMLDDIKNSVKKLFTHNEKDVEFSRGTVNPPVKKAPKKKTTSKTSSTTKPITKKTTSSAKKKTESTPKTTTKKSTSTKTSTDKKVASVKTATTKTSTVKKPTTKKSTIGPKKKTETTATTKKTTVKTSTSTTKKSDLKKPVAKKKVTTTKKVPNAPKGTKRDEKIALYIKDIKKHYGEVDESFVAVIVKNLGPSIYKKDAELVSCSDPKELDTVRRNFLVKKLGIDASKGVLDAAIEDVCLELKGVRTKYRATFYYALAKKFKKESVLS